MRLFIPILFLLLILNSAAIQANSAVIETDSIIPNSEKTDLYIRVFKKEQQLEIWVKSRKDHRFSFLKSYEICGKSGELGPKRKEGDLQIPEGFYFVESFDPDNQFYKGLKLDYPNEADRILGDKISPGSDIFIHGSCTSTGCIALSNEIMDIIYPIAENAKKQGQQQIPVHIYPCHFGQINLELFIDSNPGFKVYRNFWDSLSKVFLHFERWKTLPWIKIGENGNYSIIK
jgi:murein L,D-transpeptidase YafK